MHRPFGCGDASVQSISAIDKSLGLPLWSRRLAAIINHFCNTDADHWTGADGCVPNAVLGTDGMHSHSTRLALIADAIVRTYQIGSVLYLESGTATDIARIGLETAWGGIPLFGAGGLGVQEIADAAETELWGWPWCCRAGAGSRCILILIRVRSNAWWASWSGRKPIGRGNWLTPSLPTQFL